MLIPGDFKSNDFVNAHSKGFADAFFVCADSRGLASVEVAESVTMSVTMSGSVAPAKLLAGFAVPFISAVIDRLFTNMGKFQLDLGLYQLLRSVLARLAHFLCRNAGLEERVAMPPKTGFVDFSLTAAGGGCTACGEGKVQYRKFPIAYIQRLVLTRATSFKGAPAGSIDAHPATFIPRGLLYLRLDLRSLRTRLRFPKWAILRAR